MRHSFYGDLQGSFAGRGWDFFKRGWWLWLLAVAPPIMVVIGAVPRSTFPVPLPLARSSAQMAGLVALLIPFLAPFIYGAFKAVEWRWWISGIRFGDVRLESTLRKSALIGLYWKVIGWIAFLAAVFAAYLVICSAAVTSMSGTPFNEFFKTAEFVKSIPLLVLAGLGYLSVVLAINVVMRVYLMRDLWVRIVGSTIVHDIDAAANVAARGEMANALGEGFADGLDVAGF
jgi:hypothetical protein